MCLFLDSGLALGAGLDSSSIIISKKPPAKALTETLGSKPANTIKKSGVGKRSLTKSSSVGKRSLKSGCKSADLSKAGVDSKSEESPAGSPALLCKSIGTKPGVGSGSVGMRSLRSGCKSADSVLKSGAGVGSDKSPAAFPALLPKSRGTKPGVSSGSVGKRSLRSGCKSAVSVPKSGAGVGSNKSPIASPALLPKSRGTKPGVSPVGKRSLRSGCKSADSVPKSGAGVGSDKSPAASPALLPKSRGTKPGVSSVGKRSLRSGCKSAVTKSGAGVGSDKSPAAFPALLPKSQGTKPGVSSVEKRSLRSGCKSADLIPKSGAGIDSSSEESPAASPALLPKSIGTRQKPHVVMFADISKCKECVRSTTGAALSDTKESKNTTKGGCTSTRETTLICVSSEDDELELSKDLGPLDYDLSPLYSGGELTSTVIACYQHLLKCKYNAVGGLEDPAYGSKYSFSTQRGFFVQVLHVNGNHWIVASNMLSKQGHVQLFDSMHDDISRDTINQICSIVRSKRNRIKIDIVDVCKQDGIKDCGLYALENATTLCDGELPQSKQYIQKEMRPHLIQCLKQSHPSVFPAKNRDWDHNCIKKTKLVSVHCSCRLPEDPNRRMIQCTNCEVWYHEECEVVVARAWSDTDYPWKCRKCVDRCQAT